MDVIVRDPITGAAGVGGATPDRLKVITGIDAAGVPADVGGIRVFGENDSGALTGVTQLVSPEIDVDYRMRISQDLVLDEETFNYTAQNTGKHSYTTTTMTNTWAAGQLTTNATGITTTTTGTIFKTYATFPTTGTQTLSGDFELGFSAQPQTNTFVEFGFGIEGTSTTAPTDGVFFRLNSSGLQGIASFNGTEASTGVFPLADGAGVWAYTNAKRYQFIVYIGGVAAEFWVNDGAGALKLGTIQLPAAQGRMNMAAGVPLFVKHRITGGAAGGVLQASLGAYNVRLGGSNLTSTVSTQGNRVFGSYQGMSGGTTGSLANYANSANPTASVPSNTAAVLGAGLGGQFWETFSLAVNTDGIIGSFQVPAGTVNVQGRRLVVRGVGLTSYVQTVLVGGPQVRQFSLAFGHTTVSLATAESPTAKAARRIPLAAFTQAVTAAQAVSTIISQPGGSFVDFGDAPVFVNPGEFIQLVMKCVGTVGTSGTIAHVVTFVYGWE
jgi:hypothetical protein